MLLPDLVKICKKNVGKEQRNSMPNGIFCLKGGNVEEETRPFKNIVEVMELDTMFEEDWFNGKHLIYLPI